MSSLDFRVLAFPGAYASSVASTLDVLAAARLVAQRSGSPRPRWTVHSPAGRAVALSSGLRVAAKPLPASAAGNHAIWIVPGLGIADPANMDDALSSPAARRCIEVLRRHVARGGAVAASCSAVFLLQAAGLLGGRRVTTSWWLAPVLRQREPGCTVDSHRMVCEDGPLVTAGAAFAHVDLMIHLLRKRFGARLAEGVARVLVIDGREAQAPFVVPAMLASGNELVSRITRRLENALPHLPSVAELAGELAMNERTLARHVKAATGHSTLALFQSVRLNRARALIESSRLSIDQVAERVGYGDATALRRLMRKLSGSLPSHFRPSAWPTQ